MEESRSLDESIATGSLGTTERGTHVKAFLRQLIAVAIGGMLVVSCAAQVLKRPQEDSAPIPDNQSKINAKKSKRGPRAIGVVEFLPGGTARLVPVALWIDGRFYDASLYAANPEPMAVEPATVYEATNYGESLGLFTITAPEEVKGSWIANGKWKPRQALEERLAEQASKRPKKPANPDDDRPTLRRPGSSGSPNSSGSGNSSGSASGGAASSGAPTPAENDPNRPTLKKPAESAASSAPGASSPSAQSASAAKPSENTASPDENDPSRPLLRRGKPEPQKSAAAVPPATASTEVVATQATAKAPAGGAVVTRSFPAVSDAGPYETRSLLYSMNPEERASKSQQMSELAMQEIQKFIAGRHTPALPKTAAITDYDLRGYDLEFSNSPTLVYMAKLPVAGAKAFRGGDFDYFVTIVAREDLNSQPIKIFSSVTDSNHLDAFPRMEIIDAVDADANGRGDLLFRQYSDTGVSYSLYRVFPYDLQKVFEGGSGV